AYLVSITPDIQNSVQQKREADLAQAKREDGMKTVAPTTTAVDMVKAKALFDDVCTQCHELTEVDDVGAQDEAGWRVTVRRMIEEEEAEIEPADAELIIAYLVESRGRK
ncbi:MAG: cytochrome c5, partial [Myxococcota bacterium]